MGRRARPPETRFWEQVDKSGDCWLWTGAVVTNGYGQFYDGDRRVTAHRYSYRLANGSVPDGLSVCHKCDVRRCVRPSHLFAGTHAENMQDAMSKGRLGGPREDYLERNRSAFGQHLRALRIAAGLTQQELGALAGMFPSAVSFLESGTRDSMSMGTCISLAAALGVSLDELCAPLVAERLAVAPLVFGPVHTRTLTAPTIV